MIDQLVRRYRTKRGLTLRELAEKTGLSFSFIGDIEHGRTNPSVKSLLKLMEALEIPPDELRGHFQNEDDNSPLRR